VYNARQTVYWIDRMASEGAESLQDTSEAPFVTVASINRLTWILRLFIQLATAPFFANHEKNDVDMHNMTRPGTV